MSPAKSSSETLAIHGGTPAVSEPLPPWPPEDPDVLAALERAYADGSWGRYHGPNCRALQDALARMHGTEHVALYCSGTIAVELALRGLGVGDADEVILAGYDFPGNFRAVEAIGARPALVDIDPRTWCVDAELLDAAAGVSTKAVIVSHLHGGLAPMRRIRQWADAKGVAVLEDACQATGALLDGKLAGTWGDAGVLSFGGSKLLTAGRGGAVLTGRADVRQRMKVFAERGNQAFPLSELQAAVLVPQLAKLAERNERRRAAVRRILDATAALPGLTPLATAQPRMAPSYYKLAWRYDGEALGGRSIDEFLDAAKAERVPLDVGFRGFARRSPRRCRMSGALPHSLHAADSTVLLHHPLLLGSQSLIDQVAAALRKVVLAWRQSA